MATLPEYAEFQRGMDDYRAKRPWPSAPTEMYIRGRRHAAMTEFYVMGYDHTHGKREW